MTSTPRLEQEGTRQHGRAVRRWLLIVVLAVAGGCAQPATRASGDAAATHATVTVGPDDRGKTVDLAVGDHLVVELNADKQPSRLARPWRLQLPRSTVLRRIDGDSTLTRVVLLAEAPGTVRLLLVPVQRCDPPMLCPMADPSGQSERMHRPLLKAVAIIIRVQ